MARMKAYSKEEIASAEIIYRWLHTNSEIGKTSRTREEILDKSNVKNAERFKRAIEYLKRRSLIVVGQGSYMLIRESITEDFSMP